MCSTTDPIYALATPFRVNELKSASKKMLVQPPSYDRTVVESRWRSRNRMRITHRTPRVTDLSSRATGDGNSCSENGAVAPKKSRPNDSVSESFGESVVENVVATNCDADIPPNGSESGHNEPTERTCPGNEHVQSSDSFVNSSDAFESNNVSAGQPQLQDSSVQVVHVTTDTSQGVDAGLKVEEDCWWNKVDSRTWLQGVQSYLLLHSATDVQTRRIPVAVVPPNITPYTVIGSPAICQRATASVVMPSPAGNANGFQPECQIVRPVIAPVAGYRMSTNGVLSAVPIYYFPVVNYSVCGLTSGASAVACQEAYLGGRRSSLAAVDLVSFMHNYCLPPTSTPEASDNPTVVHAAHDVARQNLHLSSSEGSGSLLTTGVNTCEGQSVPTGPQPRENGHSDSWPMLSQSSTSDTVVNLSTSSVWLTPRSLLSSVGSGERWADDASAVTSVSSTVIVDSDETAKDIEVNTGILISENTDLTVPGWFGKGLSIRRSKRRISRQS